MRRDSLSSSIVHVHTRSLGSVRLNKFKPIIINLYKIMLYWEQSTKKCPQYCVHIN